MAVNKNFVVKNGLEVNTRLILANANTNKVGIGSTGPRFELDVAGGIGATDVYVSGIATVIGEFNIGLNGTTLTGVGGSVGIGTATPGFLLDVRSPVSTGQTALYVQGDVRITGDLSVDDIVFDQATINNLTVSQGTQTQFLTVTGVSTYNGNLDINAAVDVSGTLNVGGATTIGGYLDVNSDTDINGTLKVSGITTLGTVKIASGIVTAASGIVTYYGDGSKLNGVIGGIGINTTGGLVGFGVTYLHLKGSGVSTAFYDSNAGIATIFFQGGGGGATVSIGTQAPVSPTSGDLWFNNDLARTFIYYDEVILGVGLTAFWVDAAPFNVAGTYVSKFGDSILAGLGVTVGAASTPSIYFTGDATTGFFSPAAGQFTVVSAGASVLNINPNGISVTGIVTSTSVSTGNVVSSGIITATDFDSLSDINYKENIATVDSALSKVDQLRGVKFDWKESGLPSYGVIAQELEEVLPELVHGSDPKTVNYNGIIGVLIEAIKELKAEVEELKSNQN